MIRVLLGAGHEGRTSGSVGAPNEQSFNVDISDRVADALRNRGIEVRRINADPSPDVIAGDWDLALFVHYDADIYGSGGYFVDFPEPSTDKATIQSQAMSKVISDEYGQITKIVNHPERSNKNTRYYYMWKKLSDKTPCVIIECGVGMHVPDDHQILHFNRDLVVKGITTGVLKALGLGDNTQEDIAKLQKEIEALKNSQKSLLKRVTELEEQVKANEDVIAVSTNEIEALKADKQKALVDLEYYKPYKGRYEDVLRKTVDKYTGWELIKLGIAKLKIR